MKTDIHPQYAESKVHCSCGNEFTTRSTTKELRVELEFAQHNSEGDLIDTVHGMRGRIDGALVNAGAYSHTSIALHDALKASGLPAIEVHISDIKKREPFRRKSMTAGACVAMVSGRGLPGYVEALQRLAKL